ncbi:hypothetical protein [Runella sp.]
MKNLLLFWILVSGLLRDQAPYSVLKKGMTQYDRRSDVFNVALKAG